jgi:8-amino-7-oxononanoate synthase
VDFSAELSALQAQSLLRRRPLLDGAPGARLNIDGKDYLAFASNDYLGLAHHPALIAAAQQAAVRWGVGGRASHLVAGHFTPHEQLEQELAGFVGLPAALLFSSGYMANLGVLTCLLQRGDAVFADKLNHASLNDACLLARAEFKRFRHNDLAQLQALLAASTARRKVIAVDAVFSMDGDLAPLADLLQLAEACDAWLYLDDAHGFGLLGPHGQGSLAHWAINSPRIVYMATLGKAAGVAGAFVAGQADLIQWLINKAHTYIYTTAQPPMLAATVSASLQLITNEGWRRERLQALIQQLRASCESLPWRLLPSSHRYPAIANRWQRGCIGVGAAVA